MSLIVKTLLITRGCRYGVLNHYKYFPKQFSCEKDVSKILGLIQTRLFSDNKKTSTSKASIEDSELIYTGKITKHIKYVKYFSISTSLASLAAQPYILPKILEAGNIYATLMTVTMFGFFAFMTPLLLHHITNRYVIKLYYDEKRDLYIATVYTLFVTIKQIEFTAEDVSKPPMVQLLTTCFIKGKPVFFDYNGFSDPEHYRHIMGYDKPMDFELATPDIQSINAAKSDSEKKKRQIS